MKYFTFPLSSNHIAPLSNGACPEFISGLGRLFIPLLLIIFLLSCSNNKQEIDSILSKPLMAEILAEMELAQAAYKFQPIDQRFNIDFMFDEIYKKNKVTKKDFETSLKFYTTSPKEMDDIYNETIILLTQKQADAIGK